MGDDLLHDECILFTRRKLLHDFFSVYTRRVRLAVRAHHIAQERFFFFGILRDIKLFKLSDIREYRIKFFRELIKLRW